MSDVRSGCAVRAAIQDDKEETRRRYERSVEELADAARAICRYFSFPARRRLLMAIDEYETMRKAIEP